MCGVRGAGAGGVLSSCVGACKLFRRHACISPQESGGGGVRSSCDGVIGLCCVRHVCYFDWGLATETLLRLGALFVVVCVFFGREVSEVLRKVRVV